MIDINIFYVGLTPLVDLQLALMLNKTVPIIAKSIESIFRKRKILLLDCQTNLGIE